MHLKLLQIIGGRLAVHVAPHVTSLTLHFILNLTHSACTHAHRHALTGTHTGTHTHTYMHTHACMHTHTLSLSQTHSHSHTFTHTLLIRKRSYIDFACCHWYRKHAWQYISIKQWMLTKECSLLAGVSNFRGQAEDVRRAFSGVPVQSDPSAICQLRPLSPGELSEVSSQQERWWQGEFSLW